jgi:hypothetical protein
MTKMKQTTQGKRAMQAKPAQAQPPQHPHTGNIKIGDMGKSDDDELFVEVAVGEKRALLNVDKIADPRSGELKILTRLGEPLITHASRNEFLNRVHAAARAEPTLKVAIRTGWLDGKYVLPVGLAPVGEANIERYFDPRYAVYHRRLRQEGAVPGWLELAQLCRGKSRLITGLCHALSGVVCGAFGDEPPGVQVVSEGGMGGTTIGRVVGTVWGGDRNPARKIGCGVSCNNTGINFEVLGGAFDQMHLFLDDMHNAGEVELNALLNLTNGEGRGRSDDARRVAFCTPPLCSANVSWVHVARELKRPYLINPLVDRIMEFGRPAGWPYLFEGIRTRKEFRVYGNNLRRLARTHFGWAGPEFARRLERWLKADLPAVEAFVAACHEAYHAAAENIESSGGRDVGRISNRFATLYVAGCLAVRFKIFPFTEAEVLEALLTCHRDHVAFIDQQLKIPPGSRPAIIYGATATTTREPIAGAVVSATTPFDRLRRYINRNSKRGLRHGFIDLRSPGLTRLRLKLKLRALQLKGAPVLGYIADGEYWIPGDQFEALARGSREALALKQDVDRRGLLETTQRGSRVSYVVKRSLPDGTRPFFVVIRHTPKKSPARGQALAGAAPV